MFRSALGICLWLALLVCQAAAEHQCQNYRYFVVVTPPTVGREINTYNKWLTDDTLTMDICLELHQTETWEPFPQGTVVGDYHLHVYDEPVEGMLFYINDGRAGVCHSALIVARIRLDARTPVCIHLTVSPWLPPLGWRSPCVPC